MQMHKKITSGESSVRKCLTLVVKYCCGERSLECFRLGTFLAWTAQLSLAASVSRVYRQLLWLGLAKGNTRPTQTEQGSGKETARDAPEPQKPAPPPTANTTTLRKLDTVTSVESSITGLFLLKRFRNLKRPYLAVATVWYVQYLLHRTLYQAHKVKPKGC